MSDHLPIGLNARWDVPLQSRHLLHSRISVLVHNRNVFLGSIILVSVVKLFLSAIEPASFDLKDIINPGGRHNPFGPWIALYPPLYNQWATNSTQVAVWLSSPPSMDARVLLTSLAFRLPILALDLATAIVLYYVARRMASAVEGRLASLMWFANPFCLFAIELLGVPDVAATLLVVVAFNFLMSRRIVLSGLFLGLAIWFKFYPILLLPPLLIYAHTQGLSWRSKLATLCFGVVGLVGYFSWTYTYDYFFLTSYTPLTQPLPFIAGPSAVNSSAFVLIFFYCILGLFARRTKNLIAMLLPTLLVYYAVSNPYPQYLIWALPLMALDIALDKQSRSRQCLFVAFYALAFAQWFFTSSAFLTPSGYSLLMLPLAGNSLPGYSHAITSLLENSAVTILIVPLIASTFYASVIVYALEVARSWFKATTSNLNQL